MNVSPLEPVSLPAGINGVLRVFSQTPDERQGDLVVELVTDGVPIEAIGFAELIKTTVQSLNVIGRATNQKATIKWAIIEANIIGDRASFTLRAYGKQDFRRKTGKGDAT